MSPRPKRKCTDFKVKEEPAEVSRLWEDNEIKTLHQAVLQYGHKNVKKIQELLPGRSTETIKTFIRTAHDRGSKLRDKCEVLESWINLCQTSQETPWSDSLQIAQVLKYLSVDGLIERHPLPSSCKGIDFRLAYRLIYQALMGYPLQPVNEATSNFVLKCLFELQEETQKQTSAIENVGSFLCNQSNSTESVSTIMKVNKTDEKQTENLTVKKPLKVYQRKKPALVDTKDLPSLRIVVEEKNSDSKAGSSKDFSVTIEGSSSTQLTTINVPLPCENKSSKHEQELLSSLSYNPFQIPGKWLEEPFYLNLTHKS